MLKSHSPKVVDLRIGKESIAVGIWNSIWALLVNDRTTVDLVPNLIEWLRARRVGEVGND